MFTEQLVRPTRPTLNYLLAHVSHVSGSVISILSESDTIKELEKRFFHLGWLDDS